MVSKKDETRQCGDTNRASLPTNHRRNDDMNSVQNNELTFQQTEFHPVSHAGETWLTSSELAAALGYKKSDAVTQIFSRYHDEFTEHMSTTLKMSVVRKTGAVDIPVRVFSLRGAHLVAMFATTPKAKEFRRWVLDILDLEVAQGNVHSAFDFEMYAHNARVAEGHFNHIYQEWRDKLKPALRGVGSPLASSLEGHLKDLGAITFGLSRSLSKQEDKRKIH